MTVKELIVELMKQDPAMPVLAPTGMDWREVTHVNVARVKQDERYGYYTPTKRTSEAPEAVLLQPGVEKYPGSEGGANEGL